MSVTDVAFGYERDRLLFEHLTFDLAPGTTTAICGPSGRGKSTLLSLIAGLQRPQRGTIAGAEGLFSCWVLQVPIGSSRRTAVDHVAVVYAARGKALPEAESRARELLLSLGLDTCSDLTFGTLSGGEAQRLMLARAIAADPDIMLLDEPTAQLDRTAAATVTSAIGLLAETGRIVVVATHDESLAQSCQYRLDL
ncbi:MAG TPA: ATP-binding cassette domain-containing protein [Acidimicrobiia bacterium]